MLKDTVQKFKPYDFAGACSFFLGAIIITLVGQGTASVVAAAFSRSMPNIAKDGDFNTAFMIVFQAANAGFIILFSYITKRRFNFTFFTDGRSGKGITPAVIIVPLAAAAVLMAAMYLPTVWYGFLTEAMGIPPDAGKLELSTPSSVAMMVIAAVLFAPVCEEVIYRGVLYHGIASERSGPKAIMLSALAFMLMHMSPIQVVFQFALGVTGAYMARRSGRLLPSVILHAAANSLALVMQLTPMSLVLDGCVVWLTQNVAAAFFITLGLFAAGGAALFFGISYAFEGKIILRAPEADEREIGSMNDAVNEGVRLAKIKEGRFKYLIGIGICVIMFVVSLVSYYITV